jgi:O-antigen/teichoic acid export membrane protein
MTWVSVIMRLLGVVAVLPLVLYRFSSAEIALWLLFSVILTLQTIVDFGFTPSYIRLIAYSRAGQDESAAGVVNTLDQVELLQQIRFTYWILACISCLLMMVAGTFVVKEPISHLSQDWVGWVAWGLVVINMGVNIVGISYNTILQGVEEIARLRRWETFNALVFNCVSAILLIADKGLLWLVAVSLIASIFGVWVNRVLLVRLIPFDFSIIRPKFHKKIFQATWTSAWRSGAGITMTYGTIQGSGLLLAQLLEPPVLASFLLAQKIIQLASSISQVPFYSQISKLSRLYAQNEINKIMDISRAGMAESNWILLLIILFIGVFSQNILFFIQSKTSFVYMPIWWAIGLAIMIERLGAMYLQIYSLTNDIVWHIANGISGLLMLGLSIIFYNRSKELIFIIILFSI